MKYKIDASDITITRNCYFYVLSARIDGVYVERNYNGYSKKQAIKKFFTDCAGYTTKDIKAACTLCNFWGVVILDTIYGIDDYFITAFDYGDGLKSITKNKIYYTSAGNPYFIKNGTRYNVNAFMRL